MPKCHHTRPKDASRTIYANYAQHAHSAQQHSITDTRDTFAKLSFVNQYEHGIRGKRKELFRA